MRFFVTAVILASTYLSTVSAFADTYTRHASPGKEIVINHHETWGKECTAHEVPWVTITKRAANGKVQTERNVHTIEAAETSGSYSYCIGKAVTGVIVYYTPNKSFKGTDTFQYQVNYSASRMFEHDVVVNVQ